MPPAKSATFASTQSLSTQRRETEQKRGSRPLGFADGGRDRFELRKLFRSSGYRPADGLRVVSAWKTPWGTRMATEFSARVAPRRQQTLQEHTARVASQYERYFAGAKAVGLTVPAYRFLLLVHDAGKAAGDSRGRGRADRAAYTRQFLDSIREDLPFDAATFELIKTLATCDPLGPYLRDDGHAACLEGTVKELERLAASVQLTPLTFLRTLTPLFQSDLAAYTVDAGFHEPFFDRYFKAYACGALVFDAQKGRLLFNDESERRWARLEEALARRSPRGASSQVHTSPRLPPVEKKVRTSREAQRDLLTPRQQKVVDRVDQLSSRAVVRQRERLEGRVKALGYSLDDLSQVVDFIRNEAPVHVYFNPEKETAQGGRLIDALIREGAYKNQFESGITSARAGTGLGSSRDRKEKAVFDGMFHRPDVAAAAERPRYGVVPTHAPIDQRVAWHYGSSYFVADSAIKLRSTFAASNTHTDQTIADLGTIDHFEHLLASDSFSQGRLGKLFRYVIRRQIGERAENFLEAQVHGPIRLGQHTVALVTPMENRVAHGKRFRELAGKYDVPLKWREGFRLVDD